MEFKIVEVRDSLTFIPAMAIRFHSSDPVQSYYLRRVGFRSAEHILLMRLSDQETHCEPYEWTEPPHDADGTLLDP